MSDKKKNSNDLYVFLKLTKEEKYAPIEKSSMDYARIEEETDVFSLSEEEIYYSIS